MLAGAQLHAFQFTSSEIFIQFLPPLVLLILVFIWILISLEAAMPGTELSSGIPTMVSVLMDLTAQRERLSFNK